MPGFRDPDRKITLFVISAHGNVISASVTSGKIRVIELHPDGSQENPINVKGEEASRTPTYLIPGDLAGLESHDNTVLITRDDNNSDEARNRSSWIQGRLTTHAQRVDEVVWELNSRSRQTRLIAGNPAIAQMRVGGSYHLMRVDEFLRTARIALGFEVIPVKEFGVDDITYYILRPLAGRH